MDARNLWEPFVATLTEIIALEVQKVMAQQAPKPITRLSAKEAAKNYKVSPRTLARHLARGQLTNVGSEHRHLYDAGEIAARFKRRTD